MDNKRKLMPLLKRMFRWPIYLFAVLLVMDICVVVFDPKAALLVTCFLAAYAIGIVIVYLVFRKTLREELVRFGVNYGQVQRRLSAELEIPYAVTDSEGCILWSDKKFAELVGDKVKSRQHISDFFPLLTTAVYPGDDDSVEVFLDKDERSYRVLLKQVAVEGLEDDMYWNSEKRRPTEGEAVKRGTLFALYFYDETEINTLTRDLKDQELVCGLLYIDNYDEVLESADDVRKSLSAALVDRKIGKHFQHYDTLIKKIEKDKYVFVCQYKYYEQMREAKFPILEDVRSGNLGNERVFTVSLGIAPHAGTYLRGYEAARAAIDLALGRGGDQVVIKDNDKVEFFGGKSNSVEKNSKVKSRVKAHALRELMESKDRVLIMGHKMGDIDSFGAAVGIYRIAATLNKEAHIVLDEITTSIRPMVSRFGENPEYSGMIITPEEAMSKQDAMTMVVVVDVNKPSMCECPGLLDRAKTVVVLDHHRQSSEQIEDPALSYIESYASSACEIVSEIIQYAGDEMKLRSLEADAMFAGIMVDSNNFLMKTGIRTFEAAAFLRRNGADVTRIRKMFRTDMPEYVTKAKAISTAKTYLDAFAFAVCDGEDVDSPTVVGAQVANELMEVNNIKASFVFTEYNDTIYVSARSIDEVNVQVVMEKLGGGGHMSAAGVQFNDCTIDEAMVRVKDVLRTMQEGGEL